MTRLYFFNPWNDLALGCDATFYTPPPTASLLADSLAALPLWLGTASDYAIVGPDSHGWCLKQAARFDVGQPWKGESVGRCEPWGWSKAVKTIFRNNGVDSALLPSDAHLDILRRLSHRRLTVEAHRFLSTASQPLEAGNGAECLGFLRKHGRVVGKYPWSSTGRGLFCGDLEHETSFLNRCLGAIHHQGSVMLEIERDVMADFAMLFYVHENGEVRFKGYSLFENNHRAYTGNLLASQCALENMLTRFVGKDELDSVKNRLTCFLGDRLKGVYHGPVGVDMFIYNDGGAAVLNPCVEINLRYTMGFVALELTARHLPSDFEGYMKMEQNRSYAAPYLRLNPEGMAFSLNVYASPLGYAATSDCD